VKVVILPKPVYQFTAIPVQQDFFNVEIGKMILKFRWKGKGSETAKRIMGKKMEDSHTLCDFKDCYKWK
jgi:hypothetical protein